MVYSGRYRGKHESRSPSRRLTLPSVQTSVRAVVVAGRAANAVSSTIVVAQYTCYEVGGQFGHGSNSTFYAAPRKGRRRPIELERFRYPGRSARGIDHSLDGIT